MPKKISLTKQLNQRVGLISFIAILGVFLIVFSAISISLLRSYYNIQDSAKSITQKIDVMLGTLSGDLHTLGIVFDDLQNPTRSVRTYLDQNQNIFSVSYLDLDGNVIQNWRRASLITPPKIVIHQPDTYDKSVIWGSVYVDENNIPFIDLMVPVLKSDNSVEPQSIGWLVAQIDLTSFWEMIRHSEFSALGYVYLVDTDGRLLVHRDLKLVTAQTTVPTTIPNNRTYQGLVQQYVIGAATPLQITEWVLVVEQPLIEVLQRSAPVFLAALLMVITIWVLIHNFIHFTHRRISIPLVLLRGRVELFRQGDLSQRIQLPDHLGDEIDILTQTFNHMADAIERRTCELIDANNRAQESSRLKSEFLSIVSHELRTPLNAIMGYTGILLEGMGGEIDHHARRMITSVDNNSQRLLALITDLLDLSRIEEGKMILSLQAFNPYELARQWQEELSIIAVNKSLELTFCVDPQLPMTLYGDPERITQIAVNLITNALKFTREGSVRFELQFHITEWAIVVKDTGIGISPENLDYIFDEFRQGDSSTTREYEGVGLGLAIVRRLCRMMGARIVVQSKPGEGSTFTVYMPIRMQPTDVPPAIPALVPEAIATGDNNIPKTGFTPG